MSEVDHVAAIASQMKAKSGETTPPAPAPAPAPAAPVAEVPKQEVQTPAAPVPATPAAETTPQNAPDLKGILGDEYDSVEKVKTSLTRLKDMEAKYKELEDKVKEYTPVDPYVAELNKALKSGITKEAFDQFHVSDPSKLTPSEKISMQYQLRDGLTKAEADLIVDKRYKLGEFADSYEDDARQKQIDEITLKQDGNAADAYLAGRRSELMVSPLEKAMDTRVKEFEPVVSTIISGLSKVGEGDTASQISKETIDMVASNLKTMISSDAYNMDKATPEAVAELTSLATLLAKGMEFDRHEKHLKNEMEKLRLKEQVNPRPTNGEEAPGKKLSTKESYQKLVDHVNQFG